MRLTFVALAMLLLALAYFLPAITTDIPLEFEHLRNLALIVFAAWLALEAFLMARRVGRDRRSQVDLKPSQSDATELNTRYEERIVELDGKVSAMSAERAELIQTNVDLRRALDDARERLLRAEKANKESTAQNADAEVVNLLSLLQLKGRFIDFIMDDITKYPDTQVGAAARVVHQGCSKLIREYFDIRKIHDSGEGSSLTLDKDYDARRYRLLGRVTGEPPYQGRLLHHGWRTESIRLPETVGDADTSGGRGIIAPAEVELH